MILVILYFFLFTLKADYHNSQVRVLEMNKTLSLINGDLKELNSTLGEMVGERTRKLETQNKRIRDLAYTNSHIIRAYVARINGLVNLAELKNCSEEDKIFCFNMIKENSISLDKVTRALSEDLVTEECMENSSGVEG
jgi:light-regulated signal transduction histidine kinase (bacteriophytochrome)